MEHHLRTAIIPLERATARQVPLAPSARPVSLGTMVHLPAPLAVVQAQDRTEQVALRLECAHATPDLLETLATLAPLVFTVQTAQVKLAATTNNIK